MADEHTKNNGRHNRDLDMNERKLDVPDPGWLDTARRWPDPHKLFLVDQAILRFRTSGHWVSIPVAPFYCRTGSFNAQIIRSAATGRTADGLKRRAMTVSDLKRGVAPSIKLQEIAH